MPTPAPSRRYRARHAAPSPLRTRALPVGALACAAGVAFVGLSSSPAVSAASPATAALVALPGVDQPPTAGTVGAVGTADEQALRRASALRAEAAQAARRSAAAARPDAAEQGAAQRGSGDAARARSADRDQARASRSSRRDEPRRARADRAQAVRPVADGPLTSPFGHRWGRLHAGLDFGVPVGTPVVSVADGTVTTAQYDEGGYGYYVVVEHAGGTSSLYGHLSRIAVEGGRVQAGDVLGRSGNTGRSTGPHLHFEMRTGSGPFDARPWLRERGVRV